jgi:transposase InsO family protein
MIQSATGSLRQVARLFHVSHTTVARWRGRVSFEDASSRPHSIRSSIGPEPSKELLDLRALSISLDDIFEMRMDEMTFLSRSALYRLLKRSGMGRLPSRRVRKPAKSFKVYPPGYVHIDCFYMPRFGGKRSYCFVAVDRATNRTHVGWAPNRTQEAGAAFLRSVIEAFEFNISIVLTDNGTEFTNAAYKGIAGKTTHVHAFDQICNKEGIQHRLTKPRTPKTNGLVERYNQIIKKATVLANTYANIEAAVSAIEDWNYKHNRKRKKKYKYKSPFQKSQEWFTIKAELFNTEPLLIAA